MLCKLYSAMQTLGINIRGCQTLLLLSSSFIEPAMRGDMKGNNQGAGCFVYKRLEEKSTFVA